jgi:ATP-dependent RNA helicase DeaD
VVLDEADRMVDMGFYKDVTKILDLTTNRRNIALLSATISREVMDIGWIYQRDAVEITINETKTNKPDINQYSLRTDERNKTEAIVKIINHEKYERALVFCNTKYKEERLTKWLGSKGYAVECIHGDIKQNVRERVLGKFRKGGFKILVATDVAARGIDVENVDIVFNYDIPRENEHYTHRIGRTGRAKKHGAAYTFVANVSDAVRLSEIEKYTKAHIQPLSIEEGIRAI